MQTIGITLMQLHVHSGYGKVYAQAGPKGFVRRVLSIQQSSMVKLCVDLTNSYVKT